MPHLSLPGMLRLHVVLRRSFPVHKQQWGTMEPDKMLIKDMRFANKDVDARIRNVLLREGVDTLSQLLQHTEEELREFRGLGAVCLAELTVKLKGMGLTLRGEEKTW